MVIQRTLSILGTSREAPFLGRLQAISTFPPLARIMRVITSVRWWIGLVWRLVTTFLFHLEVGLLFMWSPLFPSSCIFVEFPNPVIRTEPGNIVVFGSTAILVCEARIEVPPISYSWRNPISRDIASPNGTISITFSSARDYGLYTCTARNEFGVIIVEVELIRAGANTNFIQWNDVHLYF